ncbi:hypothetical protein K437DRAFT_232250 [Tilletiaria anomala UBC 951]|uniref:Protein SQS1 n=1 Tax=Tilletiaria anomala (strain ATCC 24038 / CBS 436.72 / UBC 951) TaxID=1037660 RepID=A0A066WN50_TILAU|nr:uncharacterized protein K437DRAFT_232250 [Tilletiaria anomala UBC 951]KDN52404.1 hypothetical protein K437DRAFT_232250 [Tilletiaria anomala UBC 951]
MCKKEQSNDVARAGNQGLNGSATGAPPSRGRGRGRGARGTGRGRGGRGRGARGGILGPMGFDSHLLEQFTQGNSSPRGSRGGSGSLTPRGAGRGSRGRGGHLAVQGANAVQFNYDDLNKRSATRNRDKASGSADTAVDAQVMLAETKAQPSNAGLWDGVASDSDDPREDVAIQLHHSYKRKVVPHSEIQHPPFPATSSPSQEHTDYDLAVSLQQQQLLGSNTAAMPSKARRKRADNSGRIKQTKFPEFYTSRGVDDAGPASAPGVTTYGGKANKNPKIRPIEQEGDARYLAGIPPAYRAQFGLGPTWAARNGGSGKFDGGDGSKFSSRGQFGKQLRFSGARDADEGRARLHVPILFKKAEGEWKKGEWNKLDGSDTSQQGEVNEQGRTQEDAIDLVHKAEKEVLRLTSNSSAAWAVGGAGLGFKPPAVADAQVAHPPRRQAYQPPENIDLDALVRDVLGPELIASTEKFGSVQQIEAAAAAAERQDAFVRHLLAVYPGSQVLPQDQNAEMSHNQHSSFPVGSLVARSELCDHDKSNSEDDEEDDDIVLIPQAWLRDGSQPAMGSSHPGESDSEEERQLDQILAAAAAQRLARGEGAQDAETPHGKPSKNQPIVIDLGQESEDAADSPTLPTPTTDMDTEMQRDQDLFVLDTTGDAELKDSGDLSLPSLRQGEVKEILGEGTALVEAIEHTELRSITILEEPISAPAATTSAVAFSALPPAPRSIWNALNRQPRGKGKKARNAGKKARRRQRAEETVRSERSAMVPRIGDSDIEWGSDGPPEMRDGEALDQDMQLGEESGSDDGELFGEALRIALAASAGAPQSKEQDDAMLQLAMQESLKLQEGVASAGVADGGKAQSSIVIFPPKAAQGQRKRNGRRFRKQNVDEAILADYLANAMGNADEEEEHIDTINPSATSKSDGKKDSEMDAMLRFMRGMSASGHREMTLQDIEDEMRLREEEEWMTMSEEDDENEGASDEDSDGLVEELAQNDKDNMLDRVVRMAEEKMLQESKSDNSDAGKSDDGERAFGSIQEDGCESSNSDSDEDVDGVSDSDDGMFRGRMTWAEGDEDFIRMIEKLTEENAVVISGRDRNARKKLFRQIERGDFGDLVDDDVVIDAEDRVVGIGSVPPVKGGKERKKQWKEGDLWADDLQLQWNKDRETKAMNKKKRAAERQAAAADPFHNTHDKGAKLERTAKKEAKRARRQARARGDLDYDEDVDVEDGGSGLRHAENLNELNGQIQIFLRDTGNDTMSLPPMDKRSRAQVHMLAAAYGLKSKSRGTGKARFPVLIKLARSGIEVDHRKVLRILSGKATMWGIGTKAAARGKGKAPKTVGQTGGGAHAPRNREGAEVGLGADKIGADNIGHKLLSMMGWKEGAGIGQVGGIAEPVGATVKITRGGLGF